MPEALSIPVRFNGPLASGNGGYCAGRFAGLVDGLAEVRLRSPVPMDVPLDVVRNGDGTARVLSGEALVAEVRPADGLDIEVPPPVSAPAARAAVRRYRGPSNGVFSQCFVCGRMRDDALEVFAGRVDGRRVVASPWIPPAWTADANGHVRPEFVCAVLDCPTYFASYLDEELGPSVLAQFTARIDGPVVAGEEHVAIAWPIEVAGRKRYAGSALLSSAGETLAVAHALLIAPRPD